MAKRTDLSSTGTRLPSGKSLKVSLVVSEWNNEITERLFDGALATLRSAGCLAKNIARFDVPGSYELPSGADLAVRRQRPDAVICLGCVIQGETRHFEFICQAVSNGLVDVSLKHEVPVIFGVLTTNTYQQAVARAGGRHGNKGVEAAVTALRMATLFKQSGNRRKS